MKRIILTVVASCALCFAGYQWHKSIQEKRIFVQDIKSRTDQYGFLDISDNLPESKGIIIVAPVNCPSQQAKVADYLVTELNKQNIPATRTNSYNFRQKNIMSEREINQMIKRYQYVRTMTPPLVFVNGKIKSNPSIEAIKKEWELQ
ncbi:hypothetical protein BGI15_02470 [Snodgrassella alvi]|uniref:hypothetical protein n=1 Tax=Snodgrassella alvi TaxID=1196083 RepID=UPI000A0555D6|nr:hypothetical protein [Snodgrassella alvi]ORF27716.1 hypothetical protein BGI07_00885 [Snodgrassella alvi]ORF31475.1 hypothetical protein BGI10_05400 [Snodgrassella alvi]ORF33065.1 hypothetical protein BGI11_09490 [Snodgrassella alvi]ORF37609.1 hypothetical protein BGI13_08155 [Snodgrassella alvi]ORF40638.1 hypothetical protein BGI14_04560 [Snodgrassella alvi]